MVQHRPTDRAPDPRRDHVRQPPADALRLGHAGGAGRIGGDAPRKWAVTVSGRARIPGGNPLRASQRGRRAAAPAPVAPQWQPGDRVRWQAYTGTFLRAAGDGEVELLIGTRTYCVAAGELRPA